MNETKNTSIVDLMKDIDRCVAFSIDLNELITSLKEDPKHQFSSQSLTDAIIEKAETLIVLLCERRQQIRAEMPKLVNNNES